MGQYGPLVHFGATMGSALRRLTGGMLTTDVFIGCGVAGAIAAGFNAPIAGVVFAHEAILRHFSMRAIAPIAVASVSSSWFSQQIFGSSPLLDFAAMTLDLGVVLPAALVLGPAFGLVAVMFMICVRSSLRVLPRPAAGHRRVWCFWQPASPGLWVSLFPKFLVLAVARCASFSKVAMRMDIFWSTCRKNACDSALYRFRPVWRRVFASSVCGGRGQGPLVAGSQPVSLVFQRLRRLRSAAWRRWQAR